MFCFCDKVAGDLLVADGGGEVAGGEKVAVDLHADDGGGGVVGGKKVGEVWHSFFIGDDLVSTSVQTMVQESYAEVIEKVQQKCLEELERKQNKHNEHSSEMVRMLETLANENQRLKAMDEFGKEPKRKATRSKGRG